MYGQYKCFCASNEWCKGELGVGECCPFTTVPSMPSKFVVVEWTGSKKIDCSYCHGAEEVNMNKERCYGRD